MTFVFFDVLTSSSLFKLEAVQCVGMWNGQYSKISQKLDGCHDTVWEIVQPVRMRHGSVCFFRSNNAEFSVQMGNGSHICDVERFSFVLWNGSVLSFSM